MATLLSSQICRQQNQKDANHPVGFISQAGNIKHPDANTPNIATILQKAADGSNDLHIYAPGQVHMANVISYNELYLETQHNAEQLRTLPGWVPGRICLVYLDNHSDNIRWFWSVVLAGGIPAMLPPLAPGEAPAKLKHLSRLLSEPMCLTTQAQLDNDLSTTCGMQTYAIQTLEDHGGRFGGGLDTTNHTESGSPIAAIMLTSGSSGNSKAVPLTHQQIFSCVKGKSQMIPCDSDTTILNWVSMDHVAALMEAHLRGLFISVDQIYVEASDIVSNPALFLELISRHKVSVTFAPNFLLARIVEGVDTKQFKLPSSLDLTHLRAIVSGGEVCATDICHRFTCLAQQYGSRNDIIVPGFGMTETGAGSIYSRSCPTSDMEEMYEYASVGKCIPGLEMRITSLDDPISATTMHLQDTNVAGNLEIRGPVIFNGYINNQEANESSFTPDGWFRTGDMGFINHHGNLVLTGRTKEVICINGVKYLPIDQEKVIEDARISGVTPDHIACFAYRPTGAHTEQCVVIYQHSYEVDDAEARLAAQVAISKAVLLQTGTRPHILPLPAGVLQKSTLGKLSRNKISKAFEQGEFAEYSSLNDETINSATVEAIVQPENDEESVILDIVAETLQLEPSQLGVEASIFEAGITSVDLIKIRSKICQKFNIPVFSIKTMLDNGTVRELTRAVVKSPSGGKQAEYDPVVRLKTSGSGKPLWLVHPGVGEVLVFVGLAQQVQNRPVYALRARGFEEGEEVFGSIDEVVTTYAETIRSHQPQGPYAIAGYSYGSMIAVEITKRLEGAGEKVQFLGCFNLPPHIKQRMRQMTRQNCLLHLCQFLQLINEKQLSILEVETRDMAIEATMDLTLSVSDQDRWKELDLSYEALSRWAQVAYSLQNLAVDYEPQGKVQNIDVFYCDPLAIAAKSKQEWLEVHLAKWKDFCQTPPQFHPVGGAHYTMLSPDHVRNFQKTLAGVISGRGM